MRVVLTDERIEVRLALWEKILGLLGNIRVARDQVSEARVVEEPLAEALGAGIKVGLRLPWFYYVARTLHLDEAFIVKRGPPGLSFEVSPPGRLRRVLVSTPEAKQIARALQRP
jgi:hypothetical protein